MGSRTFKTILAAGVCAFALNTAAMAQEAKTFDVPAGDLGSALDLYIKQSGEQLIYRVADVRGMRTLGVRGALSPDDALQQILAGTNLKMQRDPSGLVAVASIADPQSASAAGDGAEGTVQALIVTAQKREESIQDVPIAMSAFTQEALEKSQVAGGPDLITQVPNMTFTKTNFSSYSIQIRGIGTQAISATTDPAVAVAFNNTPFIRNRFFEQEFYDLQRVEVLRGPQGTLYGRNATAGVVNIISAKPTFGYAAKLSADVANYGSSRVEGMLNVPLVSDTVALRVAGAWTKRDGYSTNELTGKPIDGRNLWSTRVSLRFAPTDALNVNLIWEHFQEDDDRLRSGKQLCKRDVVTDIDGSTVPYTGDDFVFTYQGAFSQGCNPASMYADESFQAPNGLSLPYYYPLSGLTFPVVPGIDPYQSVTQSRDLRVIESTLDPVYKAKSDLAELQWNLDIGENLTFTSETAFSRDRVFSFEDYNRFNTREGVFAPLLPSSSFYRPGLLKDGIFCDPQLGCASRLVAADVATADSSQFSQEFRLTSAFDGRFNFSLGANFLRHDTVDKYYVFINSLTLFAAMRRNPFLNIVMPPWQPGVSDNRECLQPDGMELPDPYSYYGVNTCIYTDPNPIGSLNDEGHNYFLSKNPYKLISYAIFGEAYYNITDDLKLTAGLRYGVDKKEAPRIPSWVAAESTVGYPVAEVVRQEWREPTGRLALDWKPRLSFTDQTLIYGSYSRGYKAGGANPPSAGAVVVGGDIGNVIVHQSVTMPKTFDPEFVNAFEVGSKNTLLNGRLTLNGAAFYYDYSGYQISYITNRTAVNLNFDATVWGAELEADWRPLENLQLGFKGGYENTRVADGERAVDVMDRTAGHEGWIVVRPHPTLSSNCILPSEVVTWPSNGIVRVPGAIYAGNMSACEAAWLAGYDPVTVAPYTPNPISGYPGWDPATAPPEANNGEGFYKDLSGHELPNAPHFTATITADYTIPLPNSWLATLHTDLYYQSEAWTRIFNTEGYDKLKAYSNINIAAIFTNEDAGWKVMAYVKNVLDRDSITGAFLNSDDTGLTTNVFLTEPRLYGLRVTKEFSGGPWWTGANPDSMGPFPLTVELSGQVQRHDAPYETVQPSFADAFAENIRSFDASQRRDLDWGDGRGVRIAYQPQGSRWIVSVGYRYGEANGSGGPLRLEQESDPVCAFPTPGACDGSDTSVIQSVTTYSRSTSRTREDHTIGDVGVQRAFTTGPLNNLVGVGLRYASFDSTTSMEMAGNSDWPLLTGWFFLQTSRTYREARLQAEREFKGAGPVASWEGSYNLLPNLKLGRVGVDWEIAGGALFGKRDTRITGDEKTVLYTRLRGLDAIAGLDGFPPLNLPPPTITAGPVDIERSKDATIPLVDLSLGLSYEVGRVKVSSGYRWERYFDVLDGGDQSAAKVDRTLDGPYFKIAVGFGG